MHSDASILRPIAKCAKIKAIAKIVLHPSARTIASAVYDRWVARRSIKASISVSKNPMVLDVSLIGFGAIGSTACNRYHVVRARPVLFSTSGSLIMRWWDMLNLSSVLLHVIA